MKNKDDISTRKK